MTPNDTQTHLPLVLLLLLLVLGPTVDVKHRFVLCADRAGQVLLREGLAIQVGPAGVDFLHVTQRPPERDTRLHATPDTNLCWRTDTQAS